MLPRVAEERMDRSADSSEGMGRGDAPVTTAESEAAVCAVNGWKLWD
jgi:hypothetical protein